MRADGAGHCSFPVSVIEGGLFIHTHVLHNQLFNLGLAVGALFHHFGENSVDGLQKLGVALGYADRVLLFHRSVLCIGFTCVVERQALEARILADDVLRG